MEHYSVEELDVRSEPVRKAINAVRADMGGMIGWTRALCAFLAIVIVGVSIWFYSGLQQQSGLNVEVNNLALENKQLQHRVDLLEVQMSKAQATPVPVVVIVPTVSPVPGYSFKTKAVGNRDFGGNIEVDFTLINGDLSKEQALATIAMEHGRLLNYCNFNDSISGSSWNRGDSAGIQLFGSSKHPVSDACFNYIRKLGGVVTDKGLPKAIIAELMKYQATDANVQPQQFNRLVYLSKEDGHAIATITGAYKLPRMGLCMAFSLRQAGWSGEDFFVLNLFNLPEAANKLLWDNAVISLNENAPEMPDFCEAQNLKEVPQPAWLSISNSNDTLTAKLGTLNARIHTDPDKCDQYPGEWVKGEYLLEVMFDGKYQRIATFKDGSLVLFDAGFGKTESMVYLSFDKGAPHWYVPAGQGANPYVFQQLPSVWLNPMVDGIGPWVTTPDAPRPYVVGSQIFEQKPAQAVDSK